MLSLAPRTSLFGSCITRLMSIRTAAARGINLSQGFPEQDPPVEVLNAAIEAKRRGLNQYADMRGMPELRVAVARHRRQFCDDYDYDPETEVTVTCGATEGMAAALLAITGPGDEVLVQEPTYENYPPQVVIAGAQPKPFRLRQPGNRLDKDVLESACTPATKAIILNTPNNPTGRVFTQTELESVAEVCLQRELYLLTDEVYEHLVWDKNRHISPACLPSMRERTIVVSSLSKSYAATGWRVGWVLAPANIMAAIRRVHDFLTGAAPTAAQFAAVVAQGLSEDFYARQKTEYEARRDLLAEYLARAKLNFEVPEGTYYFFIDVRGAGYNDSGLFADDLIAQAGVGVVPWQAFFHNPTDHDRAQARINFAKSQETLRQAGERLVTFLSRTGKETVALRR